MDDEDWDDWEAHSADADADRSAASSPPAPLSPTAIASSSTGPHVKLLPLELSASQSTAAPRSIECSTYDSAPQEPDDTDSESDCDMWSWSWTRMEADMRALTIDAPLTAPHNDLQTVTNPRNATSDNDNDTTSEDAALTHIFQSAAQVASDIAASRTRVETLEALALVTKLHVLAVRSSFDVEQHVDALATQAPAIVARLQELARDWTLPATDARTTTTMATTQQLNETSALLHRALAACSDRNSDLALFTQALEHVFTAAPQQLLTISTAWLDAAAACAGRTGALPTYKQLLQRLADADADAASLLDSNNSNSNSTLTIAALSVAETFQDAKDIRRDALVINGTHVSGAIGYDAVVETLQQQIQDVVATSVNCHTAAAAQTDDTNTATRAIAQQLLNACNRTESGGTAYEVLSHFVTNHSNETVLIRPDSMRAAPLALHFDVGAFEEPVQAATTAMWAFGVRATLAATTWYLVCDAQDPTIELCAVAATYATRVAFPLDWTPFHPMDAMRKDRATVQLQLVLPPSSEGERGKAGEGGRWTTTRPQDSAVEFDDLR